MNQVCFNLLLTINFLLEMNMAMLGVTELIFLVFIKSDLRRQKAHENLKCDVG